jgi:hypothetical protein
MAGTLPWQSAPPPPPSYDPNELLRRIEANTANTANWLKWLTILMVVLILVEVSLFY